MSNIWPTGKNISYRQVITDEHFNRKTGQQQSRALTISKYQMRCSLHECDDKYVFQTRGRVAYQEKILIVKVKDTLFLICLS